VSTAPASLLLPLGSALAATLRMPPQ
jgi:hypothetical protein